MLYRLMTIALLLAVLVVHSHAAPTFLTDASDAQEGIGIEARCQLPDDYVATGVGLGAHPGKIATLQLAGRKIISTSGIAETLGARTLCTGGSEPNNNPEAFAECPIGMVLVGFGGRIRHGNVTTLQILCQRFNERPFHLDDSSDPVPFFAGTERDHSLELTLDVAKWTDEPELTMITAIGAREQNDNLAGLWARLAKVVLPGPIRPGVACSATGIWDCAHHCFDAAWIHAWTGDRTCDDGRWGPHSPMLFCAAFNFDGGDCHN